MENLNNLKFQTYKINDKSLYIPMEEIVQQYDDNKFAKSPYLFRIAYIAKYLKKTNEFICYLAPIKKSKLPIVKATIPLEIFRTKKLIPSYEEGQILDNHELFIINERKFRKIDEINEYCYYNRNYGRWYILCYGYLINQYKDDDAMTKKTEGLQQFKLISNCKLKFKDRNYETSCYVTNKLSKIFDVYDKLPKVKDLYEFKDLPDNFFPEKNKKKKTS